LIESPPEAKLVAVGGSFTTNALPALLQEATAPFELLQRETSYPLIILEIKPYSPWEGIIYLDSQANIVWYHEDFDWLGA